jgi:hypothetical protein
MMGATSDGTPVEWKSDVYRIQKFELNVDILDSTFAIQFPPGAAIYDGVTGLGWSHLQGEKADAVIDDTLQGDFLATGTPSAEAEAPAGMPAGEQLRPASAVPLASPRLTSAPPRKWLAPLAGATAIALVLLSAYAMRRRRNGTRSA